MTANPGLADAISQESQSGSGRRYGAKPNAAVPEPCLLGHVTHVGPSYQSLVVLCHSPDVSSCEDGNQLVLGHLHFGSPAFWFSYTRSPTLRVTFRSGQLHYQLHNVHEVWSFVRRIPHVLILPSP